jgi:hypothetical protein
MVLRIDVVVVVADEDFVHVVVEVVVAEEVVKRTDFELVAVVDW